MFRAAPTLKSTLLGAAALMLPLVCATAAADTNAEPASASASVNFLDMEILPLNCSRPDTDHPSSRQTLAKFRAIVPLV